MAARPIDASRFAEILENWKIECIQNNDAERAEAFADVLYMLDDMPTLTPPNEPLTCEGCVAVGTGYGPCMNCIRSKPRRDLYRRPPEGEEDT